MKLAEVAPSQVNSLFTSAREKFAQAISIEPSDYKVFIPFQNTTHSL